MPLTNAAIRDEPQDEVVGFEPKIDPAKRVSEHSLFGDAKWRFPSETAGRGDIVLIWSLDLPDGSELWPEEWCALVEMAKVFILSTVHVSERDKNLKVDSLSTLQVHLTYFIRWMARSNYASFSEVDWSVAQEFLEHLKTVKGKWAGTKARTHGTVVHYVDVLCRIYEQRYLMWDLPGSEMPQHPTAGKAAWGVAEKIAPRIARRKKTMPDQVWLATVGAANAWLDEHAEHVIRLGVAFGEVGGAPSQEGGKKREVTAALQLDAPDAAFMAWLTGHVKRRWPRSGKRMRDDRLWLLYMSFLTDLRDACTVVVQAMTGIRISEMAGLQAQPADASGLPACLEVRPSRTGLNEIFYVLGEVYKLRDQPEEVEWIAGSRPRGTSHLPSAARALVVLFRAFQPWRQMGRLRDLIVAIRTEADGFQRTRVSRIRSYVLNDGLQRFAETHVALAAPFDRWKLSTHQWRRSFAQYMVRSDERLLSAVSDHFKHLSTAMTEQGYLKKDRELQALVNDVGVRTAAKTIFEAVRGPGRLGGRMAETIEANAPAILEACGNEGTDEDKVDRLADILEADDIRVWPAEWGRCMFRAETSRCHHRAKGEFDLSARRPLYGHRYPDICCDCSNLLISDVHGDFWRERHAENQRAFLDYTAEGEDASAAVAAERMRTSAAALRHLNVAAQRAQRPENDDAP